MNQNIKKFSTPELETELLIRHKQDEPLNINLYHV